MRRINVSVGLTAALAVASAALAVCHKNKFSCFDPGGSFCQGSVTACEQGYGDVSGDGFTCTLETVRVGKCRVYSGCTPGSCSGGGLFTGCESGGTPNQCCNCTTLLYEYDSGFSYKFCTQQDTCTANP